MRGLNQLPVGEKSKWSSLVAMAPSAARSGPKNVQDPALQKCGYHPSPGSLRTPQLRHSEKF